MMLRAIFMRFFRQKWLKKRMNTALCVFLYMFFVPFTTAQQPPPSVDPQPPRLIDNSPAPPARRTATPTPTPAVAAPPTLEQSLTPETKQPAADPKQRALDNLNRTLQQQGNQAARDQPNTNGTRKIDRVEVEGARLEQRDEVKDAFERNLPPPKKTGVEEVVLDNGARCTINHDCVGLFCTTLCTAGNGTLGNQIPGGISR
jgi:hypothetical protein